MNKIRMNIKSGLLGAIAAASLLLSGCSDDNTPDLIDVDGTFGSQQYVELPANISSVVPQGEITLSVTYDKGQQPIKVRHYVSNGKSVFDFGHNLRVGEYVLASASYTATDNTTEDAHLGCKLRVSANGNSIYPSTFDVLTALFGSGTADDPYLIASATGLKVMRRLLAEGKHPSKGLYFRQIADIDMTHDYNKGFVPIAAKSPYPFEGNYDGGGYAIYYCAVRTLDGKSTSSSEIVPATGLFGYVAGATFTNVTMVDPVCIGAGSTGTLIGAVVGISGVDQTVTELRNVRVRKSSSTASEVYGSDFVGGIVGGVDANAVLMMSRCENENLPVSNGSDGSFAGGLVGGGTINATAMLDSCVNRAPVTADGSRCTGGIIGGIETAYVSNCINYGTVTAAKCTGTGGIAGGLGSSTMVAVVNNGEIRGHTGTGGILGSTVIERESGCFNDFMMSCGHNYGVVRGENHTGGVVGEAQAMLDNCYNRGHVIGSGNFAGGIMGFAPVGVIHSCYNNGPVDARQCAGGIAGRSAYYILTDNANLGAVSSSGGMAGGILALGGSTGMVNFCNNYGPVSGAQASGGIVAKAGYSYSLTDDDVCSMIVTAVTTPIKLLLPIKQPPCKISHYLAPLKKAKKVIKIFTSAFDVAKAFLTPAQYDNMDYWESLYKSDLPARNNEFVARMHSEVSAAIPLSGFTLSGVNSLPEKTYRNMIDFDNALQDGSDDMMSEAIHDRLTDINEQVTNIEEAREIALAITSCVLAVAGLVIGFVAPGPGTAGAILVCSSAVSTVGTMSQRCDNSVEISQCCNFGAINAGEHGFGIVGSLGDHVKLMDCVSAGQSSGCGIADKSDAPLDDIRVIRTISAGTYNQDAFADGKTDSSYGNFSLVADDYFMGGNTNQTGHAKADKLASKQTYTDVPISPYDFDNHRYWSFMSPAIPTPYNNMYFSFK